MIKDFFGAAPLFACASLLMTETALGVGLQMKGDDGTDKLGPDSRRSSVGLQIKEDDETDDFGPKSPRTRPFLHRMGAH